MSVTGIFLRTDVEQITAQASGAQSDVDSQDALIFVEETVARSGDDEAEDSIVVDYGAIKIEYAKQQSRDTETAGLDFSQGDDHMVLDFSGGGLADDLG